MPQAAGASTIEGPSNDSFRLLFEHARDGLFIADAEGRYVAVNHAGAELLGYEPGELEGRHIRDVVRPIDLDSMRRGLGDLERGLVVRRDWTLVKKDGATIDVELTSQRLPDGRLTSVMRDITERRRVQRELAASEERLRATIEGTPDVAVQWYDADGRVRLWNRASERMFGFTAAEAIGKTLDQLIHTPEEQASFVESLAQIGTSGVTIGPVELGFRRRDQTQGTCLSTLFAIPGEGEAPYFVCMDVDLTERKRVESELRQSQKEEVLGRLAGGIAHDFNNLLTAVVGFSELGLARTNEADAHEFFGAILESAQRGATLTGNLLAFARKRVVAPRSIALREIIDRLLPLMRPLIGAHIELVVRHDDADDHVLVDVGSIEQLVMNLVVNARDAMPRGGRLVITTRVEELDPPSSPTTPGPASEVSAPRRRFMTLRVGDTGQGVPPDLQARVFEPFFTTKEVGHGTGLGLAMCAGIVRQAGGLIELDSPPGQGATFVVRLPARPPAPDFDEPPRASDDAPGGDETVLLVEDDPTVQRLTRRVLDKLGYRVLQAGDGRSALDLAAQAERVDLLLADLAMPDMGGLELAEVLLARRPELKVLFVSGYAPDPLAVAKRHTVLAKPFAPSALARSVRAVLDT